MPLCITSGVKGHTACEFEASLVFQTEQVLLHGYLSNKHQVVSNRVFYTFLDGERSWASLNHGDVKGAAVANHPHCKGQKGEATYNKLQVSSNLPGSLSHIYPGEHEGAQGWF